MGVKFIEDGIKIETYGGFKFEIHTEHEQDCCENVYAHWEAMDIENIYIFDELKSVYDVKEHIELVEGNGFRIFKEFVPCYNRQNGYYSDELMLYIEDLQTNEVLKIDITKCNYDDIG